MVRNTPEWSNDFPHVVKHQRTTLHFKAPLRPHTRHALERLIDQASRSKRISTPLDCPERAFFTKREKLDSLKKKWRVQRGRPKRNGMFDWPIEELINTQEASRRGARVPPLVGYGYSRSKLGLVQDLFLITQHLDEYHDGLAILRQSPEAIDNIIRAAFELLHALHSLGITHMDLWAANIMLPTQPDAQPQAIDLENSFHVPTDFLGETLGFQFGFFYFREVYRYITEADYDTQVEQALSHYFPHIDREAFERVYRIAKHQDIGRLERRDIFLTGTVNTQY
ncbi:lipopolysaccharide kinase InaA family protein [Pseudomonas putida]|uniref:Lipopolysaccharide kinase (Kdo/WaaP) family protein n=1 Tax=Pseudomonas putida TaxID=303 RepID=A0A1X1A2X4_PSEPU|nr:lipopolysaccharide kinase InaA family protein [Pseudomonas putida]ORL66228.1 hypothetical protein B7H17_05605 [Pseudomonas putida]